MIPHRIIFPQSCEPRRYYDRHPTYIRHTAMAAGIEVIVEGDTTKAHCRFGVNVDGTEVVFDYDNYAVVMRPCEDEVPVFKLHTLDCHPPNIHPFPVVSFYDWRQYSQLERQIEYRAVDDVVFCRQQPWHGSKRHPHVQRQWVQHTLRRLYGDWAIFDIVPQEQYWREIATCLVSVFVPGARNDMLDRGHAQHLAFGACTIAPPIKTLLPWGCRLEPGIHYVQCRADYTDLCARIEWCRGHRDECKAIGDRAKKLFQHTSTPKRAWEWVGHCLRTA